MAADFTPAAMIETLKQHIGDKIINGHVSKGEATLEVQKEALMEICRYLKTDSQFQMNYLVDVLGVDYAPALPRFEVVYHLYSITKRHRLRLKAKVDENESIPTVSTIWASADWPEREVYDMFGIRFNEHPNLTRIYLAADWEGFPLRKDYPLRGYKDQYNPFGEEKQEDW